ncbi:MAG TPA: orotidine-5'-phosphate decarboxylase [Firmicutes bacterium]|jgi:orotidine-5'-phosphate decarboxylase|nr:orotidine-5'-phosphate decarboxylase [Bacillota bacterium]
MKYAMDRIIVALDYPGPKEALSLVEKLQPHIGFFKIGLQLFVSAGPQVIREIKERGGRIFLDLKFHDIPNTVGAAVRAAAAYGVDFINVHASGGSAMMRAAVQAAREGAFSAGLAPAQVLGVTVLTSMDSETLKNELGVAHSPAEQVLALARLAKGAGLDGVVASPQEVAGIRQALGKRFLIVTPGIRPAGSASGDQVRIGTPAQAIRSGADYLVIGRPITQADDPLQAINNIAAEISGEGGLA